MRKVAINGAVFAFVPLIPIVFEKVFREWIHPGEMRRYLCEIGGGIGGRV